MRGQQVIEGFRLSPQQTRLWSLCEGPSVYAAQCVIALEGELDRIALKSALQEVVDRYEIFRTTFNRTPSLSFPLQIIAPSGRPQWREVDFSRLNAPRQAAEFAELLAQDRLEPFDFQRGPLVRAALYRLSERAHLLSFSLPALCADARTLNNLFAEIAHCYGALLQDSWTPFEPVQFVQFSEWQLELLESEQPSGAYWNKLGTNGRTPPVLPGNTDSDQAAAFEPETIRREIDGRLAAAASGLAEENGGSSAAFWLACWQILLQRLSGAAEISLGYVCDGRKFAELSGAMGLFARRLPIFCRLPKDFQFRETLLLAIESVRLAYQWQEYFVEGEGETDSLLTEFEFQTLPASLRAGGVEFSVAQLSCLTNQFQLKLSCQAAAGSFAIELQFCASRYQREGIERWADSLVSLAENAACNPDARIDQLPIMGENERRHLLETLNKTEADFNQDLLPIQLFEAQVLQAPDEPAVVCGHRSLSYNELNCRANQLANHLRAMGVGPETPVGIYLGRSAEMIVALLGIMKAGGYYAPLDATLSRERLAFILEDARIEVLLTKDQFADQLPPSTTKVICLDSDWEVIAQAPDTNPGLTLNPENAVYIIYTSGSTGKPKGVVVEHRQLLNYLLGICRRFEWEIRLRFGLAQSLTVDFSNTIIFPALCTGGCLHVLLEEVISDAAALADYFSRRAVEVFKIAPSHLAALLTDSQAAWLTPIKWLVLGGEASRLDWVREIQKHIPGCRIFNHYGPTETTVGVLTYCANEGVAVSGTNSLPTGRPVPNARVYVLDPHLDLVPMGVPGELYVGGEGVARGYLNRAELTAERFIPDPYGGQEGGRLYRTGDLARHLPDGNIEFLGRADHQVKVRGYRVELGEIESVLQGHHLVRAVAVALREEQPGDQRLVAYVVTGGQESISGEDLRRYLLEKLPDYMAPAHYVMLDVMPLTRSGKIDRLALPAPNLTRSELQSVFAPPRTPTETSLAKIWADVIGLDRVGIDDNFFALGGDSIRSIQVLARARQLGIEFNHVQLFQRQTIRELAQAARVDQSATLLHPASQPFSLISQEDRLRLPDEIEDAYPLAKIQAGMIFHSEYSPDSPIYHDIHTYHLRLRFDRNLMQMALDQLIDRHPVLRTSFDLTNFSQPLQLVHRIVQAPVETKDLRSLPEDDVNRIIAQEIEDEKSRRIDWDRPPLLRVLAHLRSEEEIQFTLSYHHAILDGWSSASFQTELIHCYVRLLGDASAAPSGPLAVSYRDYVAQEQIALESEECREYWRRQLAGNVMTRVPRWSRSRSDAGPTRATVRPVPVRDEISERLKSLSRSTGIPIKNILLAAHVKVLNLLSGQPEVITGLVSNSRLERIDGDKLLGVFLNTVPFPLKVGGGSWADLARQIFEAERAMLPFQRYPMSELQRARGGKPLFEVVFNFMHFHVFDSAAELNVTQVLDYTGYNELNYPLTANFSLAAGSSQVELLIDYHASVIAEEQIEAISQYYVRALEAIAIKPFESHQSATLLSEQELQKLLVGWNQTERECGSQAGLHELFEAQAARSPELTAVVYGSAELSYGDLNRRANQLARYLRRAGVGMDEPVGVYLNRSADLVAVLLGVLKAGGCYLPLDVESPRERLEYMAREAGVKVVVSDGRLGKELSGLNARVVEVDVEAEQWGKEDVGDLGVGIEGDHLAYVIFTSGSTGRPKGVAITHRGVVNYLCWCVQAYDACAGRGTPLYTSMTFDLTVTSLFVPLIVGQKIILPQEGPGIEPLAAVLQDGADFSFVKLTPAHLDLLSQSLGDLELSARTRAFIIGGEALSAEALAFWRRNAPGAKLINEYGPTETSVGCCVYEVPPDDVHSGPVPIGRPIWNTRLYILDSQLRPLPIGVSGELYVGGEGVARGYLNRAELTAERFIPDPYGGQEGGRLYRTGDLARHLPDGNIEFLGRADHQVKVRGYRVELGEIESVLQGRRLVRAAAVALREEQPGDQRLVAYVVTGGQESISSEDLRRYLREKLPSYMMPSYFVFLESLPLTSNGKVDRSALPDHGPVRNSMDIAFVAPGTAAEEVAAELWKRALRVDQIGLHDNFFELGGHSLLATQLVVSLRETLRVDFPLRELYDAPTISGMIDKLAEICGGRRRLEEIAQIVREIARLSEEEISAKIVELSQPAKLGP